MRNFFTKAVLIVLMCKSLGIKAQAEWSVQLGGAQGDIPSQTCADLFGNIYTVGTYSGTASFGSYSLTSNGKGDVFVTKINANNGSVVWVKQIGGTDEDNANAVVCDPSGNVFVTGRFSGTVFFENNPLSSNGISDAYIMKLDPFSGLVTWVKKLGGSGKDCGLSLCSDASGNIYSSGYFQGTGTFDTFTLTPVGTNFNIFLFRINANSGSIVWAKGYGSSGYSFGTSVACDASGDVYLTGYYEGSIAFGSVNFSAVQYNDIFNSKHSKSTGDVIWATSEGGSGNDTGNSIIAGSGGFIYSTGKYEGLAVFGTNTITSQGSSDIFVTKRNALNGNLIWVKQFGGQGYEQPNAISLDANAHLFVTGQFNGFANFDTTILESYGNADVLILELDAVSGNVILAGSIGGKSADSGYGITIGSNNALYLTGTFQNTINVGGPVFTCQGATDIFIMKLNSTTVGIQENNLLPLNVLLMPVPFQNELEIVLNNNQTNAHQLMVRDVFGKIILQINSNEIKQQLNLGYLQSGVYFISIIEINGNSVTKKVVKN